RVEGQGQDWFDMQDRIVRSIVGTLAVKLTSLELQRVKAKPVESAEAYDLVLRARELIQQSGPAANRAARQLLNQAIALSPNDAEAYVALGDAEYQRASQGFVEDPLVAIQRSQQHFRKALSIDDPRAHARAHANLARTFGFQGLHEQALAETERAIELNPSDSVANFARATALLWTGKLDLAIAGFEATRRLDPRGWADLGFAMAFAYFMVGRSADAIATTDTYIPRYSQFVYLRVVRAAALAQAGRLDEAQTEVTQIRQLSPFIQVEQVGTRFTDPANASKIQDALRKAGM
ncbi:MAG: tetratricopeptide repeat protein, partial [Lysobacterales bacterium]